VRIHFTALGKTGWGEVTLALRMALDARQAGHDCTFTVPDRLVAHVAGEGFRTEADPGGVGPSALEALARQWDGADLRVLVDLNLGSAALLGRQIHPEQLGDGPPLAGIDTWHFAELGTHIHLTEQMRQPIEPFWRTLPRRLVPVPFVRPDAPLATRVLDDTPPVDGQQERARLGLVRPTIALCTSWWQHDLLDRTPGVLPLLELYLARLGVDLLHIGPADLPFTTVPVRRLDALPPERFARTLAAVDLVLSLNASATSNTTALQVGTPVLTLWNRWVATGDALAFKLKYSPSAELREWLRRFGCPPRFAMWPMDWTPTFTTLLADNPYGELLHLTDLLDERQVQETASTLLMKGRDYAERRADYLAQVARLPSPHVLLERFSGPGSAGGSGPAPPPSEPS
jgi:hypothetical protein